jgi:replicative DNA helicase
VIGPQLVEADNPRDDRVEQLAKVSRGVKRLARQTHLPIILLVQVNRQSEGNADLRPRLHQLKGCGDFEQDADSVVFVFRPHFNAETGE